MSHCAWCDKWVSYLETCTWGKFEYCSHVCRDAAVRLGAELDDSTEDIEQ